MSNPVVETKIELLTESIEALVLAQVTAITSGGGPYFHKQVVEARGNLSEALRGFLQPALRLVTTQRHDRVGDVSTTLTRTEITGAREIIENGTNLA
jgi:hypothetical protein